jgi:hypothetical protein
MTVEQVRSAFHAEPFQPFVLQLSDGRQIPVHQRDFMLIVPSGRTIVVVQPDEKLDFIDLETVTNVNVIP